MVQFEWEFKVKAGTSCCGGGGNNNDGQNPPNPPPNDGDPPPANGGTGEQQPAQEGDAPIPDQNQNPPAGGNAGNLNAQPFNPAGGNQLGLGLLRAPGAMRQQNNPWVSMIDGLEPTRWGLAALQDGTGTPGRPTVMLSSSTIDLRPIRQQQSAQNMSARAFAAANTATAFSNPGREGEGTAFPGFGLENHRWQQQIPSGTSSLAPNASSPTQPFSFGSQLQSRFAAPVTSPSSSTPRIFGGGNGPMSRGFIPSGGARSVPASSGFTFGGGVGSVPASGGSAFRGTDRSIPASGGFSFNGSAGSVPASGAFGGFAGSFPASGRPTTHGQILDPMMSSPRIEFQTAPAPASTPSSPNPFFNVDPLTAASNQQPLFGPRVTTYFNTPGTNGSILPQNQNGSNKRPMELVDSSPKPPSFVRILDSKRRKLENAGDNDTGNDRKVYFEREPEKMKTAPPLADLDQTFKATGQLIVRDLLVEHVDHGSIQFHGFVDLTPLGNGNIINLSDLYVIKERHVVITLYNISRAGLFEQVVPKRANSEQSDVELRQVLELLADSMGVLYTEYDEGEQVWTFQVKTRSL